MENLNAEQIKKALECCVTTSAGDCMACGYRGKKDKLFVTCTNCLISDALALITSQEQRIKELTEENERWKNAALYFKNRYEFRKKYGKVRADTVNRDQIAKEMLEGDK